MRTSLACLLFAVALSAGPKRAVTLQDLDTHSLARPVSPVWSPDDKRFVYVDDEKLFLFDIASKTRRELTSIKRLGDQAAAVPDQEVFDWTNRRVSESPVQWFADGTRLLVLEHGDLFTVSLKPSKDGDAAFEQLTRTAVPENDPKLSPDNRFVSFRRAHDLYVLELATKKVTALTSNGTDTLLNGGLDWVYPEELDLRTAHWWSPDSRSIAYLQLDTHAEPVFPQVSLLKARGLLEPERYPKAGDPNAEARLGVVSVNGGPTTWMDLGETRDYLLARVTWVADSSAVTAIRLNRIQNNLDLLRADPSSGRSTVLLHESDPTWVNVEDEPRFLKNGDFIWGSERSGFLHLYLYGSNGQLKHAITRGDWVVERIMAIDEAGGRIYFMSSEGSPLESHLYAVDMSGENRKRLTSFPGVHGVSVSPHGEYFTDSFSNSTTPSSQAIRDRSGSEVFTWMAADNSFKDAFDISVPEIVQVPAADGQTMYARLIKPAPFDPARKYPVIIEVYGGPHVQVVRNQWVGINRERLLAAHGFVVWQLDNRGSFGRGHKWESVVFRNLGQHELEDQKAGVEYLKKLSYVDASRIGIFGFSYGGYMTLYSLLNAPGVFRAGVAGAPVTDWRNYDSIYTERYMGLPGLSKDAYDHSANVTHASSLQDKLLIVHNIEDDNVHFANSMQMAEALERANKQFRMVVYPQKAHGITGPYAQSLSATLVAFFEETLK